MVILIEKGPRPVQPFCRGKPLTYWVEQWTQPGRPQVETALQELGPRAVPFLLWSFKRGEPLHQRLYQRVWLISPEPFRKFLPSPHPSFWMRIPWALGRLGPTALPELCVAHSDLDPKVRQAVHNALSLSAGGAGPSVVAGLTNLLNHPDGEVRGEAAFALGELRRLHRGVNETEAVPALRRMLTDPYPYARQEAAVSLWWIERDTNMIKLLITELAKAPDLETGTRIVDHFFLIGGPARVEFMAISNAVWSSVQLRSLSNAIRLIPKGSE